MSSCIWDQLLRAENPRDIFQCLKTYLEKPKSDDVITPKSIKRLFGLITANLKDDLCKEYEEIRSLACACLVHISETNSLVDVLLQQGLLKVVIAVFAEFVENVSQARPLDYAQIVILEKLALLVQRISYATDMPNEDMVTKLKLVELLLKIIGINNKRVYHYLPSSAAKLENLSRNKALIGQVCELQKEQSIQILAEFFSVHDCYPNTLDEQKNIAVAEKAYSVDLYDTTNSEDLCIRDELLKTQAVWPCSTEDSLDSKDSGEWLDIEISEVINAGHFWAHIGEDALTTVQKIEEVLREWPQEKREPVRRRQPYQFVCIPPVYSKDRGYCRGQILCAADDENEAVVFAFDYGSVIHARWDEMFYLNAAMNLKGIGPQAVLCHIKDTKAPPASFNFVHSAVSSLANLCIDIRTADFVVSSTNVKVLANLCVCPDLVLSSQCVKVISNLSHASKKREFFTQHGIVDVLLDLLKKNVNSTEASALNVCILSCLTNLLYENLSAKQIFTEKKGPGLLLSIVNTRDESQLLKASFKLLYIFTNTVSNSQSDASNLTADIKSDEKRNLRRRTRSRSRSRSRTDEAALVTLHKSRLNQEWSSDEEAPDSLVRRKELQKNSEPAHGKSSSNLNIPIDVAAEYHLDNHRCFVKGAVVRFTSDQTHELCSTSQISKVSAKLVAMMASAFLNSGKGGSLFYGIRGSGLVDGMQINRGERDEFRLGVDREMGRMNPPVRHDLFDVNYYPVLALKGSGVTSSKQVIEDLYVVEIEFNATTSHIFSTCNLCYMRRGSKTVQVSTQDIYTLVHEREEMKYQADIDKLMTEIRELQQQTGQLSANSENRD